MLPPAEASPRASEARVNRRTKKSVSENTASGPPDRHVWMHRANTHRLLISLPCPPEPHGSPFYRSSAAAQPELLQNGRRDPQTVLPVLQAMLSPFCPGLWKQSSKIPRSTLASSFFPFIIFPYRPKGAPRERKPSLGAPSQREVAEGRTGTLTSGEQS